MSKEGKGDEKMPAGAGPETGGGADKAAIDAAKDGGLAGGGTAGADQGAPGGGGEATGAAPGAEPAAVDCAGEPGAADKPEDAGLAVSGSEGGGETAMDWGVLAAENVCWSVLDSLEDCYPLPLLEVHRMRMICGRAGRAAMAEFTRQVGRERAQPMVLWQQLKLLGHVDDVPPTAAELLIVQTFVSTLCGLDAFDKAWRAANARPEDRPSPAPLPIDETTLEPVDGPMETW